MFKSDTLCVGDLETLGRYDDTIILSGGFVTAKWGQTYTFKELVRDHSYFIKFDVSHQIQLGRTVEPSTREWWKSDKVSDAARKASYEPNRVLEKHLRDFFTEYRAWCHSRGIECQNIDFADRNLFDFKKLDHVEAITLNDEPLRPWNYHDVFDIPSVLKAWGGNRYGGIAVDDIDGFIYHHPVHDAAIDFLRLQYQAAEMGIVDFTKEEVIAKLNA